MLGCTWIDIHQPPTRAAMSKRTCVLLSLAFAFLVVVRQYGTEVEKVNELDEEISLNKSSSFNSSYYHNDTVTLSSQAPAPRSNSNHHFITPNSFEEKWSWNNTDWNEWVGKCCGRYINTHTGCRLARWYYLPDDISNPAPRIHHRDCDSMPTHRKLIHPRVLKENDTIYVNFIALEKFIDRILDDITVKMVIISGQDHLVLVPPADHAKIKKLLDNKNVLHWFCQNLPIYGGGNLEHEKLSPWPYGLKGSEHMASSNFNNRLLKHSLEESFTNKTKLIYAGPLTKTNAIRKHIPQESERISQSEFFGKIASAYYILSPDGDRPDCHRHYESILFGTVPITQMDSFLYRHLSGGPVIFDNANWNLTAIGKRLDPTPVVNRNLMLQDYWRDFADYIVGFELNWSKDSQDMYGFASGPNDAWSPIREAKNEWVQVSDFLGLCTRYSMMNLANPEWGLSGNGSEAMTRHIACCLESSTNSSLTETINRTSTEDGALQQSILEKPSWFDRESGWSGSTYNEAEKFCLTKRSSLCSYAQICPEGVGSHLNI